MTASSISALTPARLPESNSTGDPFADALLGNFNSLGQNSAVTTGQFRFNDFESYVQDTWKVNRKLSLVLGVRYSYSTPTYAQGNNMTNFNPFAFNPSLDPTFTGGLGDSNDYTQLRRVFAAALSLTWSVLRCSRSNAMDCSDPGKCLPTKRAGFPLRSRIPSSWLLYPNCGARFLQPENLLAPRVGFRVFAIR